MSCGDDQLTIKATTPSTVLGVGTGGSSTFGAPAPVMVKAEGQFSTHVRDILINNLSAAVKGAARCRKDFDSEAKINNGGKWCDIPGMFKIDVQDADPKDWGGPSEIQVNVSNMGSQGLGACEAFTTIGISVLGKLYLAQCVVSPLKLLAGVMPGGEYAGVVFSLASLFC